MASVLVGVCVEICFLIWNLVIMKVSVFVCVFKMYPAMVCSDNEGKCICVCVCLKMYPAMVSGDHEDKCGCVCVC